MVISKVETGSAQIMVTKIAIPSVRDISLTKDIAINTGWWFKESENDQGKIGFCVEKLGTQRSRMPANTVYGIRPICKFLSPDNSIGVGDEFVLNYHLFIVVKPTIAICKTVIGYANFHDAPKVLDEWLKTVNYSLITKVVKKECFILEQPSFVLPGCLRGAKYKALFGTGISYWTKSRTDEFTCQFVETDGAVRADSINSKHNICPLATFQMNEFSKRRLYIGDIFEFDNRLFCITAHNEAICLNSIGFSCYSSGIAELGAVSEETEFYKNSEAYLTIKDWVDSNWDYWKSFKKV